MRKQITLNSKPLTAEHKTPARAQTDVRPLSDRQTTIFVVMAFLVLFVGTVTGIVLRHSTLRYELVYSMLPAFEGAAFILFIYLLIEMFYKFTAHRRKILLFLLGLSAVSEVLYDICVTGKVIAASTQSFALTLFLCYSLIMLYSAPVDNLYKQGHKRKANNEKSLRFWRFSWRCFISLVFAFAEIFIQSRFDLLAVLAVFLLYEVRTLRNKGLWYAFVVLILGAQLLWGGEIAVWGLLIIFLSVIPLWVICYQQYEADYKEKSKKKKGKAKDVAEMPKTRNLALAVSIVVGVAYPVMLGALCLLKQQIAI